MSSVLTKLGMFHCQQQRRAFGMTNFQESLLAIFGGYSSEVLLTLELGVTQSFIAPDCESMLFFNHMFNLEDDKKKVINPLHEHAKYKLLGLFSIFYLAPLFLRNYHIDLLNRKEKNYTNQIVALVLYAPRVFCLFYELVLNILLYLPLRIANFLFNHESKYLTKEQYESAKHEILGFIQMDEMNDQKLQQHIVFKLFNRKSEFSELQITIKNSLLHHLRFVSDAVDNNLIHRQPSEEEEYESLVALCAAGYFGEDCYQETRGFYP